ncbi:MAG: rRNA pseudouridine synthase [Ruminococcus sp.]|uniref:pseudouridine synthase n=1 Tax=Ruminococcus sp. TaxID=41978 RepID=UPI002E764094|nr:pseudouridine synthase [Ruminococcus sp.]MBQ4260649.1 rRNA pseudouridine synthase [Ruminococcus sp.]MEE1263583.1 pseudouridine synthase [Ruminococcus sp.]
MERLDKFLSARGTLSRKEAQKSIKSGEVTVNGEVCRTADFKVDPETDAVSLRGQAVCADEHVYIMLNKPPGVVSATEDKRERTVIDILPPELRRKGLFPAGRLDKDTEGLLIITDDGDFAHRMLSPGKHVEKRYIAQIDGEITDEMITAFENGIIFADGTECMPAKLEIIPNSGGMSGLVTICEGKYHQVKKMFSAVGHKVVHLQRISIGNLYLDSNLPIGYAKKLTKLDIDAIFVGNIH